MKSILKLTKQELNGTGAVLFILQHNVQTIQVASESCLFIFYSKWEKFMEKIKSFFNLYECESVTHECTRMDDGLSCFCLIFSDFKSTLYK